MCSSSSDLYTTWNGTPWSQSSFVNWSKFIRLLEHSLSDLALILISRYFQGILFLTTNRVKTFDVAFQSRIHVALHFGELSKDAKAQVWRAFLRKAGVADADALVPSLAARGVNGRQIKNAVRTAGALAASVGEPLGYAHLESVLAMMREFEEEMAAGSEA